MIKNYLKVAFRHLVGSKVFSTINILGLAVGMTAAFLIFLFVHFELSYDNFHSKADRIYRVVTNVVTPTETQPEAYMLTPVGPYVKKDFPEVESFVRIAQDEFLVRKGNVKFQEKRALLADSTLFDIFDFPLLEGNPHTALVRPMSVVLSQSAAKKYFGKTDPLGQEVLVSGGAVPARITGIMKDIPENSQIQADMIVSLSSFRQFYGQALPDSEWTNHTNITYLLLKPNITAASVEKKFPAFLDKYHGEEARRLQMHDELSLERLRDVYLRSDKDGPVKGSMRNVYIFSIIGIFILVIAAINFINLTTARSTVRAKEVGIRKVVGAARRQVASQFIGESVLVCLLAYLLSLAMIGSLIPLFNQLAGKTVSAGILHEGGYIILLFGIAAFIGVAAGIYPSLVLSSFKPVTVLKGRFATASQGLLLRKVLVIFQFTISIILIVATLVVYTQLRYMRNQDLGFSPSQEIIINTNYDKNKDAFKQSLAAIPGVLSSTWSNGTPGGDHNSAYTLVENSRGEMQQSNIDGNFVDFDYIRQYDLKLVAGRGFSLQMRTDSTQAMVINEAAARMLGYRTPQAAIGRKWEQWGRKGLIIGVVRDFHYVSLQKVIQPFTLRIEPGNFNWLSIKVATAHLPLTLQAIAGSWNRIIPNRPFEYNFLDEYFNQQYKGEQQFGRLFIYAAVLAIFISCLGLLGLASYSTLQRTKEIGVRKVLGASVSEIVRLLSIDLVRLVGIAFLIAAPIAGYAMHRWLQGFAYSTTLPWWIFLLAGVLAIAIVLATILYQALRAARTNPVRSLRME